MESVAMGMEENGIKGISGIELTRLGEYILH